MTRGQGKVLSAVFFMVAILVLVRWFVLLGSEEERSLVITLLESTFLVWAGVFFLRGKYIH